MNNLKDFILKTYEKVGNVYYYVTDYKHKRIEFYTRNDEIITYKPMSKKELKKIDNMDYVNAWNYLVDLFGI